MLRWKFTEAQLQEAVGLHGLAEESRDARVITAFLRGDHMRLYCFDDTKTGTTVAHFPPQEWTSPKVGE